MTAPENLNEDITDEDFGVDETEGEMDTDFNLDSDFKEDPLAPIGTYTGRVKEVRYESKLQAICWHIVAVGNIDMMMSDNESPLDGTVFYFRNWLPRKGDEVTRTKSGRSTKRQSKINMLKQFQDIMRIDMNTPEAVQEAIANAEWVGMPVLMQVGIDEYNNRTKNVVNRLSRLEEDEIPDLSDTLDEEIPF
jgi:hypothetical protein